MMFLRSEADNCMKGTKLAEPRITTWVKDLKLSSLRIWKEKVKLLLVFTNKAVDGLIFVEDLISAIKIARIGWAMPLFGSEASTPLLMRLKDHCRSVIVWLDSDKWKNSHDIVKRSQSIGLPAMSVFTNLDPKEYSDEKIKYFLTN